VSSLSICPRCGAKRAQRSLGGLCGRCVRQQLLAHAGEAKPRWESPVSDEFTGTRLGRYQLLRQLGEGGCGVVYAAEQQEPVRRNVALKIIKPGMETKAVVTRFEAERQALAMMDHPGIAKVFDAGITTTGRPYFVMELVEGIRITDYCDQFRLSTGARIELFIRVCQSVAHAHQKGIIHRDLKPSNILVGTQDGVPVPKVIDFGIAKATEKLLGEATSVTESGAFLGTPAYMSPEQAESTGQGVDTRTDIYSLGALLCELLTGHTPFSPQELTKQGPEAARRMIRHTEPPRPSTLLSKLSRSDLEAVGRTQAKQSGQLIPAVRGDLDWIVMKCLEKDRERRYDSAEALALDLRRHLSNEPVTAAAPSVAYQVRKFARRHRLAVAVTSLVVGLFITGAVLSAYFGFRAVQSEALARKRLAESEKARGEAEAIANFLTHLFQSPDPKLSRRTVTVAEMLGDASRRIETELSGQPERQANLRATLGATCRALGLRHEAVELWEKVVAYRLASSDLTHPETLEAMRNLAVAYLDLTRRDDAIALCDKMLAACQSKYGPAHPQTRKAMAQLAWACLGTQRQSEAIQMEEEVLAWSRAFNGPDHPDTVEALSNLGWMYNRARRFREAVDLQTQASALLLKRFGREHPKTINTLIMQAASLDRIGQHDQAIRLQQELLELSRKVKGPDHPENLWVMGDLADSYYNAGRTNEALQTYQEVLTISREINGPDHGRTIWAIRKLDEIHGNTEHFEDSRKLQK